MTDLEQLMRDTVGTAPEESFDVGALVVGGRRRIRRRRTTRVLAGSVAVMAALVVVGVLAPWDTAPVEEPAGVPVPEGTVLHLGQAETAVEGRDFTEVIARDIPTYPPNSDGTISGVTDDGLLVLAQSPGRKEDRAALTLVDPASGEQDPLPNPDDVDPLTSPWPLELDADRLVYWVSPRAQVLDRDTRRWTTVTWNGLPRLTGPEVTSAVLGPDDRIYLTINPSDSVPGEFGDESGAVGVSYDLWSVSLTDPTDVRDELLRVGQVDFTSTEMVWTDRDNGNGGLVHVRDLATGGERSFDPRSGARCNLLGLSVSEEDVVLNQYCGTYPGEVRDDRIQIVTTTGEPVVTIQGDGISGGIAQVGPGDVIQISNFGIGNDGLEGAYAYDLESRRLLRFSDANSIWEVGGPTPPGSLMWATPLGEGEGIKQEGLTQYVARLLR